MPQLPDPTDQLYASPAHVHCPPTISNRAGNLIFALYAVAWLVLVALKLARASW